MFPADYFAPVYFAPVYFPPDVEEIDPAYFHGRYFAPRYYPRNYFPGTAAGIPPRDYPTTFAVIEGEPAGVLVFEADAAPLVTESEADNF